MSDDDRPNLKLVSEKSARDVELVEARRQAELALNGLSHVLRRCTANLLRVCRGAGNPSVIAGDFVEVVDRMVAYRSTCGRLPSPESLGDILYIQRRDLSAFSRDEQTFNYAQHDIMRGSLQYAASIMLEQLTHQHRGSDEMLQGVLGIHKYWFEKDAERKADAKAARAASRPPKRKRTAKRKMVQKPASAL